MRWITPPIAFADLFQRVFGQDFEYWRTGFTLWQCEQVARNEWRSTAECGETENSAPVDAETTATTRITGIVVGPGDVPIPSVPISACNTETGWYCNIVGQTISDSDGTFDLPLRHSHPGSTPYLLVLELGEDCPRPYVAGEILGQSTTGTRYEVGPDGLADVRISVPINACGIRVTGTVRLGTDTPMYLTRIQARLRWGDKANAVRTLDGRFWITVPHISKGIRSQNMAWLFEFTLSQIDLGISVEWHPLYCDFAYAPATVEGYIYTGDGFALSDGEFYVPAEGIDGLEIVVDTEVCTH